MEKLVAIIDTMPEYGKRLAMYLNAGRTFPYRAVMFASAREVEGHIKNDGVYAVLVAEELEKEVLEVTVGTKVKLFRLSETKDSCHATVLYRYASAKEIERRLAERKVEEKQVPILGFFSPAGGSEAERLSRKIAEGIGKRGKVLYLSLFPFGIYGRDYGDGLSEALYSVGQAGEECRMRLQGLLQRGETMDSIGPVRWYTDLAGVTGEDVKKLLQGELWDTEYQAFFVAVGQFDKAGRNVLNCCDCVLVPVWETESGSHIQEEFRRQLKESGETKVYSGMLEFPVKESCGAAYEEAVEVAVKRGGEAIVGSSGRDTKTDAGTAGFID